MKSQEFYQGRDSPHGVPSIEYLNDWGVTIGPECDVDHLLDELEYHISERLNRTCIQYSIKKWSVTLEVEGRRQKVHYFWYHRRAFNIVRALNCIGQNTFEIRQVGGTEKESWRVLKIGTAEDWKEEKLSPSEKIKFEKIDRKSGFFLESTPWFIAYPAYRVARLLAWLLVRVVLGKAK